MRGDVVLLVVFSRAHTSAKAYQLSNPISDKTYSNLELDYWIHLLFGSNGIFFNVMPVLSFI